MTWFRPRAGRRSPRAKPARRPRYRPCLEPLEDRLPLAVFTVISPGDTGGGTGLAGDLRYCLTQANATPGLDAIQFAIPGSGPHTINLASALPAITDAVFLDGYSQPGASANTLAAGDNAVLQLELNGTSAGAGASGLRITSSGSTVRGLAINRFNQAGILLSGASATGNTIAGNFLGADLAGSAARGNGTDGLLVTAGARNNTLGGTTPDARNLIAGNAVFGIALRGTGTSNNRVEGNFIGTDSTGTAALPNNSSNAFGAGGVTIDQGAANNTLGGTSAAARNLISGNLFAGVVLFGSATDNSVTGNYIGTEVTGTAALGNRGDGIYFSGAANANTIGGTTPGAGNLISGNTVDGIVVFAFGGVRDNLIQGNLIGTNKDGTAALGNAFGIEIRDGASNNTVGGTAVGARNVISGNAEGVVLNSGARGNVLAGNFIGTDASGTAALGNTVVGVNILNGASNNTLGGTAPAAGNLISGNRGFGGVLIQSAGTSGNVLAGNFIGTDASGTTPLGNTGSGLVIELGATNNTVGGATAGAGNTVAYNRKGVVVAGNGTTGNAILGNSVFANLGPGIDLGDDGVTLNDAAGHNGPNNFQNFPVLTQVTALGASRTVFGHLNSAPGTTFRIEFFANDTYNPSGYGEGQVYVGFVDATTDAAGLASFTFTYTDDPAHPFLTSTASGPSGTSEFSGRDLPPSNRVPGAQITDENVPLSLSGAAALSISDPDNNGTDPVQVALTAGHGTLTLGSLAGLTGSGDGTSSLTYTGTVAALNAALAGLTYTPAPFYDGPDTVTLTTSDLAAPELGGHGTATSRVPITVVDVVNPPRLSVSDAAGNEAQAIPLLIHAGTVDTDGSEALSLQVSGVPAGVTLSAGTDRGNGVWTLTADQLNGLTLTASDNLSATLTVTATSTLLASGATAVTTQTLLVTAANAGPTATMSNAGPIAEGRSVTVFFTGPSDPSRADTTAGFRYSFALSPADLAASYAAAGPDARRVFAFDDSGLYIVHARVLDKDGGFTDYTTTVLVHNIAPTASLGNAGPIDRGGSVAVLFKDPSDPSLADTAAGFHYSFALSPAGLATRYGAAGAAASQQFAFEQAGTYPVYGRVFDKDGGFSDFTTTVQVRDLPPPLAAPPPPTIPIDASPLALPAEPPPVLVALSPLPPGAAGITPLVPPLPPAPGQSPSPVGGDSQAGDAAGPPSRQVQVEFGPSLAGSSSFEAPAVSPVLAAQAFLLMRPLRGDEVYRAPPGPEAQTAMQASQVVSPHLDGDDSVQVFETLLGGTDERSTPGIRLASGSAAPGSADAPAPLPRLVLWLAIPAGVAFAALGWLWYRGRRGRIRTAGSGAPLRPRG
jgi:hypothetical protein